MENTTRRERVTFNQSRKRLDGINLKKEIERDYVLHWANDDGDRLEDLLARGYEFVTRDEVEGRVGDKEVHGEGKDIHNRVSKIVINDRTNPVRGFLMKIRKEYRREDLKQKAELDDEVDNAIRGGTSGGTSVAESYGSGVSMTRRKQ